MNNSTQIGQLSSNSYHFSTSFCTNGDLLSQWRGYSSPRGFAVGLDRVKSQQQNDELLSLSKVEYEEEKQIERIVELTRTIFAQNDDLGASQLATFIAGVLTLLLREFKDKAFSEENEWRLDRPISFARVAFNDLLKSGMFTERDREWVEAAHRNDRENTPPVRFRSSPLVGLVPYIEVDIGSAEESAIREIVIGPTPYPEASRRAIGLLLRANSLDEASIAIRSSQVALRT